MDINLPLVNVAIPWPLLVLLGLLVGTLQGFFGVGGGWLTTPALNILGLPMVYAIGTDLAYTVATAAVGAFRHYRLGNLQVQLGAAIGLAGVGGMELARRLVFFLDESRLAGTSVRAVYIVLLLGVGISVLVAAARGRSNGASSTAPGESAPSLAERIRMLPLAPRLAVPKLSLSISVWVLAAIGLVVGFVAGFLGTGGGFIMLPLLIYIVGVPTRQAVATSLLSIIVTNGYGALAYGTVGRVELVAVALMLVGSFVGAQLGASATVHVRGRTIELLLGATLILASAAIALRQIELVVAAAILIFATGSIVSATVLGLLFKSRLRAA